MFKNPRKGRQARNYTKNVPKILDLKLFSKQIFSKNCRWVPLRLHFHLPHTTHKYDRSVPETTTITTKQKKPNKQTNKAKQSKQKQSL